MAQAFLEGKVAFVNHEKQYVLIEYVAGGKKRNVNGSVSKQTQEAWIKKKLAKKQHAFSAGDVVKFTTEHLHEKNRMVANDIVFLYNHAFEALLQKSKVQNEFAGYIKKIDEELFVKEIDSYQFIKLDVSPWQILPPEQDWVKAVKFKLEQLLKGAGAKAVLLQQQLIPEYYHALKHVKSKQPTQAKVVRVSPYAVYLSLFGGALQAKVLLEKFTSNTPAEGTELPVIITHLSKTKIIAEPVHTS